MMTKYTILIVEDDEPMRFLFNALLKEKYYLVFKNDGLSAMKWLANGNLPSLILSDFRVPKMNGFDLLNSLAKSGIFAAIPFIIISSRTDLAFKRQCMQIGAKGFVEKPFDPPQLYELIDSIIEDKVELKR